jgi:antitoxin component YwqK of YwqJK toxin-antitoxin module
LSVDLSLACPVKGLKLDDLMISETKSQINNSGSSSTIGLKIVTEKHKNGKVKVQGQNNKEGNQEGTWKYFNELGKLERVENYKNGISHGEWKFYDTKTGKISKTEKYNEGELME